MKLRRLWTWIRQAELSLRDPDRNGHRVAPMYWWGWFLIPIPCVKVLWVWWDPAYMGKAEAIRRTQGDGFRRVSDVPTDYGKP